MFHPSPNLTSDPPRITSPVWAFPVKLTPNRPTSGRPVTREQLQRESAARVPFTVDYQTTGGLSSSISQKATFWPASVQALLYSGRRDDEDRRASIAGSSCDAAGLESGAAHANHPNGERLLSKPETRSAADKLLPAPGTLAHLPDRCR